MWVRAMRVLMGKRLCEKERVGGEVRRSGYWKRRRRCEDGWGLLGEGCDIESVFNHCE